MPKPFKIFVGFVLALAAIGHTLSALHSAGVLSVN